MQDRFAGDIGDYVKLAILRALMPGRLLGVSWWLYPDESHNNNGRHLDYLTRAETWREFDPQAFDYLKIMVNGVSPRWSAEGCCKAQYISESLCPPAARQAIDERSG